MLNDDVRFDHFVIWVAVVAIHGPCVDARVDSEERYAKALRLWLESWPEHPYTMNMVKWLSTAFDYRAQLYELEKKPERAQEVRAVLSKLQKAVDDKEFHLNEALPPAGALLRMNGHSDPDSRVVEKAGDLIGSGVKQELAIKQAIKDSESKKP